MRAVVWIAAATALCAASVANATKMCQVDVSSPEGGRLTVGTWEAMPPLPFAPLGVPAGAGSTWYPPVKASDMALSIEYAKGSLDDIGRPNEIYVAFPRVAGDASEEYEAVVDTDGVSGAHFDQTGEESGGHYAINLVSPDLAATMAMGRAVGAGKPLSVTILRHAGHWVSDDFDGTHFELKAYDAAKPVMTTTFDTGAVKARDALLAEGKRRLLAGEGDCRD